MNSQMVDEKIASINKQSELINIKMDEITTNIKKAEQNLIEATTKLEK